MLLVLLCLSLAYQSVAVPAPQDGSEENPFPFYDGAPETNPPSPQTTSVGGGLETTSSFQTPETPPPAPDTTSGGGLLFPNSPLPSDAPNDGPTSLPPENPNTEGEGTTFWAPSPDQPGGVTDVETTQPEEPELPPDWNLLKEFLRYLTKGKLSREDKNPNGSPNSGPPVWGNGNEGNEDNPNNRGWGNGWDR